MAGIRVGRPPLDPDCPRRIIHSVRLRPALSEQAIEAARSAGRSVSEEIAWRLAQSFEAADLRKIIRDEVREAMRDGVDVRARALSELAAMDGQMLFTNEGNSLAHLGAGYGKTLSYLNGEPKTDH